MTVLLVATGGTIASRPRESDGAVAAALTGDDLVQTLPADVAHDVEVVDVGHGPSWNFEPEDQAEIARTAAAAIEGGRAGGVVVTHGTDTVEETAWLTELLARPVTARAPIVFTAAMRHAAEVGADGPRNLADAISVARDRSARARGVLLCAHGELHHARWVTKTDTSSLSTFRSPGAAPVGRVAAAGVRFSLASPAPPPGCHGERRVDTAVAVVVSHGGVDGGVVDWHVDRGAHGLVIDATGAGNVNELLVPGVQRAIDGGVAVVVASRCLTGRVAPTYGGPGGHAELAQLGVVGAGDLSVAKARVALMVALAADPSPDAVRAWFARLVG